MMQIEPGYCQCGCGQKTNIYKQNVSARGDVKGQPKKYIRGHQPRVAGEKHHRWNPGIIKRNGYLVCKKPDHPRANKDGFVFEHILVAESMLGRPLEPEEVVHHYGEKTDNSKIIVCKDRAQHNMLHQRKRALEACGNEEWRKCKYCKKWDHPEHLVIGKSSYHIDCQKKYMKEWRHSDKKDNKES